MRRAILEYDGHACIVEYKSRSKWCIFKSWIKTTWITPRVFSKSIKKEGSTQVVEETNYISAMPHKMPLIRGLVPPYIEFKKDQPIERKVSTDYFYNQCGVVCCRAPRPPARNVLPIRESPRGSCTNYLITCYQVAEDFQDIILTANTKKYWIKNFSICKNATS